MSRHRAVRNLDLDDELAEDFDYEGEENPYEDISEEDRTQLEDALAHLIGVIGQPGSQSGFTEKEMKDTLWDAYFDVDQSVTTLIEERSKREQKEKRRIGVNLSSDPPLTALQRLSLERPSSRGRNAVHRGRGRGRGGRGRGISRIANDDGMDMDDSGSISRGEKRAADGPAESAKIQMAGPDGSARPSKLAALAAARASNRASMLASGKPDSATSSASELGKPLSKLQQRMQANLAARQQRRSGVPSKDEEAKLVAEKQKERLLQLLPSGDPIRSMFPIDNEENAARRQAKSGSKPASGASTPIRTSAGTPKASAIPSRLTTNSNEPVSQLRQDIEGLGLSSKEGERAASIVGSDGTASVRGTSIPGTPRVAMAHERIVEEWKQAQEDHGAKKRLNLVVVGHVDAGKSTLMGRLLHNLGSLTDKEHTTNERASAKLGKGSFAYAWALDSNEEERERGVTIDVAQDHFATQHRVFTLLDAPGHRDFIPNMISGAAQADAALLVVDASLGAFEAGFGPQGQTREHALLVRSLGVQQLVIVVNKMDAVGYDQARFREIEATLKPFLATSGFDADKISMIPCGAYVGENLDKRQEGGLLSAWYHGSTLIDVLDTLAPPVRRLDTPLRMPITNVFRAGQTAISSGVGVSGRLVAGVLSVGDRLSVVPGDASGIVKAIEHDGESVPWAVAGSSVTVFLSQIEMIFISIGAVLCPPTSLVNTSTSFVAQVLVFEPSLPILAGTTLDLHHHSSNVSATVSELLATLDIKTGAVIKQKPRVLSRGATAKVRITLASPLAIETFAASRDMGRILLRMHGETVAAGIVIEMS